MIPIHADRDLDIVRREMPVNADGQATGATVVTHASGLTELWAYYASCCCCAVREPFFSPADRDAWAEVHRADHPAHAMQLTTEPWDYRTPPWVAADGLPLTPPRSLITLSTTPPDPFKDFPPGFPRPDWDDETLALFLERRAQLQEGCPKHTDAAKRQLTFYKELFVNDPDTGTHAPTMAVYADGCMISGWRLDVKDEEPEYEQAPAGSY